MTKAEALRKAQIALLDGTAETKPLPDAEKGASKQQSANRHRPERRQARRQ